MNSFVEIFENQKRFFATQHTRDISERIKILNQLGKLLFDHEEDLCKAIGEDFGKSAFETYETELGTLQHEIRWLRKSLLGLSRPKRIRTNLANIPGSSYILQEPYGATLIISTWNYPYLLSLKPAISAIAAGNTVILKPSELAPASSRLMEQLINNNLDSRWFAVVEGGVEEATQLLNLEFDKIFYTGSTRIGKIVMAAASNYLAHVTLELGGKSPCVVFPDSNLNTAVKRIIWGKFLNAGQTCIATDYVVIHTDIGEEFIKRARIEIERMFGSNPIESPWLCQIINDQHFNRLKRIIEGTQVICGGETRPDKRMISPTIVSPTSVEDPLIQEEIFGPILPLFTFSDNQQLMEILNRWPKPLAMYIFSNRKQNQRLLLEKYAAGGVCINDTVMHISNPNLPFGGVGPSGSGRYQQKAGFLEFSNPKSILKKAHWLEFPFKYPPYSRLKRWIIRRLI